MTTGHGGPEDLLTADEVAQMLKVTPHHVRSLVRSGALSAVSIGRRQYRIRRRILDRWLDQQQRSRTIRTAENGGGDAS